MKVKLLQRSSSEAGHQPSGAIVDVPDAVGRHLIDSKQAAAVDAADKTPIESRQTATSPARDTTSSHGTGGTAPNRQNG